MNLNLNEKIVKAYHLIITELEAPKIVGKPIQREEWYTISDPRYFINRDDLESFLHSKGFINPNEIIDTLVNRGFLIKLPEKFNLDDSPRLRSLHMDVLIRSSQITTLYGGIPYILSSKLSISKIKVPTKEDRNIDLKLRTDSISKKLWSAIFSFFNEDRDLTETYVCIIRDYLGDSRLDVFQSYVLHDMLLSNGNVYAIIAPTGSGKTEIYSFYMLAMLLKWRILEKNFNKKIILVYPRKALTIDQSYRLIRLLGIANAKLEKLYNVKLTFAIRDGATPRNLNDINPGEPFRGINCYKCNSRLVYRYVGSMYKVRCENERCDSIYDFVKILREEAKHADVIATNPWALEIRLLDSAQADVNANTISNSALIIFDETHEYTGLSGGILATLIKVIKKINNNGKELKLIFSSATIPNPRDFISKLSGDSNCKIYDFHEEIENNRLTISGERLVILGYFMMNPQYSWNTYCQLWSVFTAFLSYAYGLRGFQEPQSILFINNIRELRRICSGYIESLRIGEPKDHLVDYIDPLDPYCYWHYLPVNQRKEISQKALEKTLYEELNEKLVEMHSEISEKDRSKVANALRGGKGLTVLSTSSLEVGVDYDGVSFILNVGLDNPVSLIQRIGRGGRSVKTLRTVLGIFLVRALPTEILKTYDNEFMKSLASLTLKGYRLLITKDNPQIIKRGILIETIANLAKKGVKTHASTGSGGHMNGQVFKSFISELLGELHE
jgi:DEAD/DEAH box helicase domain-containing protein